MPYKDKIKRNENSRKFYQRHRDKILKKHKLYRKLHHQWYIEYARNYRIENKEKDRLWRKDNRDRILLLSKKSRDKYKSKQHQRYIANRYFKREKECFNCGCKNNLEFHHTNYNSNKIITLCMRCHKNLHRKY